jgi:hypothetical protein
MHSLRDEYDLNRKRRYCDINVSDRAGDHRRVDASFIDQRGCIQRHRQSPWHYGYRSYSNHQSAGGSGAFQPKLQPFERDASGHVQLYGELE